MVGPPDWYGHRPSAWPPQPVPRAPNPAPDEEIIDVEGGPQRPEVRDHPFPGPLGPHPDGDIEAPPAPPLPNDAV